MLNTNPVKRGPGRPRAEMTVKAIDAIKAMLAEGETVTEDKIAERAGVAAGTANKAWSQFRATQEAAEKATAETRARMLADQQIAAFDAKASDKSKVTLEKAIGLHKKRLEAAWWPTVWAKVKEQIAKADDAMRKQNAELRQEVTMLRQVLAANAQLTPEEYALLVKVAHPDNSASVETRNAAFDLIRKKKLRLVKE